MKRLAAAVLLSISLAAGSASAQVQGYIDGRTYLQRTDADRTVYVMGLYDMLMEMGPLANERAAAMVRQAERCLRGKGSVQLRDWVDSYVRSKAEYLQYSMSSNFIAAVMTRCPA